jgi:DNA-directed RNA polymerase sigma subunit (sigma70/sigma32)
MADTTYARTMAEMSQDDRVETTLDAAALTQQGLVTRRQYDILWLRTAGESHAMIGEALGLSRQRVAQIEVRTLEIMNQEAEKGDTHS